MTWDYRIIKHDKGKHITYAVHEVYYDNGKIMTWTVNPIVETGAENKEELIKDLEMILRDSKRRLLVESRLPNDKEIDKRMEKWGQGPFVSFDELKKSLDVNSATKRNKKD